MRLLVDDSLAVGWRVWQIAPAELAATCIVKAECELNHGTCSVVSPKAADFHLSGDVTVDGIPGASLWYAGDFAPVKPRTDVLVVGTAYAADRHPVDRLRVGFTVGPVSKSIDVVGDRTWTSRVFGTKSDPAPFTSMPLRYERAFGGPYEKRNRAGTGQDQSPPPNLELVGRPVGNVADTVDPAGFGPLDESWQPRCDRTGTYDARWRAGRWPWYAANLDPRYFNSAPDDQQADPYLRGDEPLELRHLHPARPDFQSRLPGLRARWFVTEHPAQPGEPAPLREAPLNLDTVWISPDTGRLVLVWRGQLPVRSMRLSEVQNALVLLEPLSASFHLEYYRAELARRIAELDRDPVEIHEPEPPDLEFDVAALEARAAEVKQRAEDKFKDLKEHRPELHPAEPRSTPPSPAALLAGVERRLLAEGLADAPEARTLRHKQAEFERALEGPLPAERTPAFTRAEVERLAASHDSFAGAHIADVDLSGADLSGLSFRGATFERVKLDRASLARADCTGAVFLDTGLRSAFLLGAILDEATFVGTTELEGATLANASLNETRFFELSLRDLNFSCLEGAGVSFVGCNLTGAYFDQARMKKADFRQTILDGASFRWACLEGADFTVARCRDGNFTRADLTRAQAAGGVDFSRCRFHHVSAPKSCWPKAILTDADFSRAWLERAQFAEADLSGGSFERAYLVSADFADARLDRAVFRHANLLRASFDRAQFGSADVRGANCYDASFWEADAEDADFAGANLKRTLRE